MGENMDENCNFPDLGLEYDENSNMKQSHLEENSNMKHSCRNGNDNDVEHNVGNINLAYFLEHYGVGVNLGYFCSI